MPRLACVAIVLVGCAMSRSREMRPIGDPCDMDVDCESTVCAHEHCTEECATSAECPAGWVCTDGTCGCTATAESCNGRDDDCDGAIDDAATCGAGMVCTAGMCACDPTLPPVPEEVDLLLAIDNSGSMTEEQFSLLAELPRLFAALVSGDRDGDGLQDFFPVRSLHVGIVTSDMGSGSFMVPTCSNGTFGTRFGDDGVLRALGSGTAGCLATYPTVFEFSRGGDSDRFAADVGCVAMTGTNGCGFEQQLESVLKALSPSVPQSWTTADYSPPLFHEGSSGHADRENGGFIRDGSVLAIVMLSDEEDCSWAIADLVNPASPTYGGTDLNLRCFTYPDAVHQTSRYVAGADERSGLLGLRRDPSHLVFVPIVGVPADLAGADYDGILADDRMRERPDPTMPTRLTPSCDTDRGVAFPPRRFVQVADGLERAGARTAVGSICESNLARPVDALIAEIGAAVSGTRCP